jgi:hypothetical protein
MFVVEGFLPNGEEFQRVFESGRQATDEVKASAERGEYVVEVYMVED